jgi:hypothetical protein
LIEDMVGESVERRLIRMTPQDDDHRERLRRVCLDDDIRFGPQRALGGDERNVIVRQA